MTDLEIYRSDGTAVFPRDGDDASGAVRAAIEGEVDLYVDPGEGLLVVAALADLGNSIDERVFAAFTPAEWTDVVERLTRRLLAVERRHGDGEEDGRNPLAELLPDRPGPVAPGVADVTDTGVEAIRLHTDELDDPAYGLLSDWFAYADADLSDLGFDRSLRRVAWTLLDTDAPLETLGQTGERATVAMAGHDTAAVAVRQFLSGWDTSVPIVVFDGPPPASLLARSDASLGVKPGAGVNFEPTDDRTHALLTERSEAVRSAIKDILIAEVQAAADAVVDGEGTPAEKCSDLSALVNHTAAHRSSDAETPPPDPALELDASASVHEAIDRIEGVGSTEPAVEALPGWARADLRKRVLKVLRRQEDAVVDELRSRSVERLQSVIDALERGSPPEDTTFPVLTSLEIHDRSLETMALALDGQSVDPPEVTAEQVHTFEDRLAMIRANEHYTTADREAIHLPVRERIETERASIRERATDRLATVFDAAVSDICKPDVTGSLEDEYHRIKHAIDAIDRTEVPDTEPVDPPSARLARLVRRLADSRLITAEVSPEILDEPRSRLRERLVSIQTRCREQFRTRFESHLDALRRSDREDEGFYRVGLQLHAAQELCADTPLTIESPSEPVAVFREFVDRLNDTPVLPEDTKADLRRQFRQELSAAESDIEARRADELRDEFSTLLDQLGSQAGTSDDAFDAYDRIDNVLSEPDELPNDRSAVVKRIRGLLKQLNDPSDRPYELLSQATRNQLRNDFADEIQRQKNNIREEKVDNIAERFETKVQELVAQDKPSRETLKQLWALTQAIRNPGDITDNDYRNGSDTFRQALDLAADLDPNGVLLEDKRKEAQQSLLEVMKDTRTDVTQQYRRQLTDHFETRLRAAITDPDAMASNADPQSVVDQLDHNLQVIKTVRREFDSIHKSARDDISPLDTDEPRAIIRSVRGSQVLLEPDPDDLLGEFESVTDELIATQKQRKEAWLGAAFEEAHETIAGEMAELDRDVRIDLLGRLGAVLKDPSRSFPAEFSRPFEDDTLPDFDRLVVAARNLSRTRRVEFQRQLEKTATDRCDEWCHAIVSRFDRLLDEFLANARQNHRPEVAVRTFLESLPNPGEYRNGQLHDPFGFDSLNEAAEDVGRFVVIAQRDHTHPTQDDVDSLHRRLVDVGEEKLDTPNNTLVDRFVDRLSR
jgi:acetolactate synthase small subunit